MSKTQKALLVILAATMVVGAGCLKSSNKTANQKSNVQQTPAVTRRQADDKPLEPKDEFAAAQANFKNSKSFKAKFSLPTTQGVVKGELEFLRPNRFQGTMKIGDGDATDMVLVSDNLYMRVGTQRWLDISRSKVAKQTIENMKSAVDDNKILDAQQASNLEIVSNDWDQLKSCDLFTVKLKDAKPDTPDMQLCIKNLYPLYFEVQTAQGTMHVDYFDYNTVFLIERPM